MQPTLVGGLGENTKTVGLDQIDGNLLDFCFARPKGTTFIWSKPSVNAIDTILLFKLERT